MHTEFWYCKDCNEIFKRGYKMKDKSVESGADCHYSHQTVNIDHLKGQIDINGPHNENHLILLKLLIDFEADN
jgi:hypothetical protein